MKKKNLLERQIKDLLLDAPIPAEPARDEIEAWMIDMYFHNWKSREPMYSIPGDTPMEFLR